MYFLMAAVALASCSNNEIPVTETVNGGVEIKVSTGIQADGLLTRTPLEGTSFAADNTLPAKVMTTATSSDYKAATLLHDGTMLFQGATEASFATPQYYPADGSTVYFCGLFPATGWTAAAATGVYEFDGKTDVMAAKEIDGSKTDKTSKFLTFNHMLTKLIIKAQAEDGMNMAEIVKKWGNITGISFTTAPNNKVTVDLKNGTAAPTTAFAAGVTAVDFYQASGTAVPYNYTDDKFAAIAVPAFPTTPAEANTIAYSLTTPYVFGAGVTEVDLKFNITTEHGDPAVATAKLSGTADSNTQGKYCIVTLTFKLSEIKAAATITDWVDGGSASGDVE